MINPCHRGTHAGVTAMTQYTRGAGGSRTPTDPAGPVSPGPSAPWEALQIEPVVDLDEEDVVGLDAEQVAGIGTEVEGADVLGARGVGIQPLLLDRDGLHTGVTDCHRIASLMEVPEYLSL